MYSIREMKEDYFDNPLHVCSFTCDTEADVTTLPTAIAEGTGGESQYDNRKCAPGSDAYVVDPGATYKVYMLDHNNNWIGQ